MAEFELQLIKNKLLAIARSGVFVNFPPEKIEQVYVEIKQLLISGDTIEINELYDLYELHFYLSLITSHDVEAKTYLDRIIDQFGDETSQRISLLKSVYLESQGEKGKAASILSVDKNELKLSKRLIAYKRSSPEEYIKNMVFYLDLQPADLIAWSELADEYTKLGHYDKSIFCLKEILLEEPNYKKDVMKKDALLELVIYLENARNSWLRTIEVCKDHKKSWMGIYLICNLKEFETKLDRLANVKEFGKYKKDTSKLVEPSKRKVLELNDFTEQELANLKSL